MFGRAFNSAYKFGDGQPWASTQHPVASKGDSNGVSVIDTDAGTYSNYITSKLSVSAITTAQTMANRFKTPDGLPFLCDFENNGILLVSPELAPKAKEICGENAKLLPESSENGSNPVAGLKYLVIGGGDEGFSSTQWAIADRNLLQKLQKLYLYRGQQCLKLTLTILLLQDMYLTLTLDVAQETQDLSYSGDGTNK